MLLSLKSIAYDTARKGFFSPSRPDFLWPPGFVGSQCNRCNKEAKGYLSQDCTCGLYNSPNKSVLKEYHHYPNSIIVLLNLYGTADIWTGPYDLPNTFVVRAWAAKIIGVILENEKESPQRYMSTVLAANLYQVNIYPEKLIIEMIQANWMKTIDINPYPLKEVPTEYLQRKVEVNE